MWKATSIQLALFCGSEDGLHADVLFEVGLKVAPETTQRNRTLSVTNPFFSVASGTIDGLLFSVQVQPGRVDFHVLPPQVDEVSLDGDIPLFDCEPVLQKLIDVVEALGVLALPVTRVALVPSLLKPVADYAHASQMIAEFLAADISRDSLSDLLFQVARRKNLDGHQVFNRLLRLSVLSYQAFGVIQDAQRMPFAEAKLGVLLMLDFNTVPGTSPFNPGRQLEIAMRLRDELLEVAKSESPVRSILDGK